MGLASTFTLDMLSSEVVTHEDNIFLGRGLQVLPFLDDIFPALLSSLSDTSDEVGPTSLSSSFFCRKKLEG